MLNVGEMQRKLSLWAEQDRGRKFYGLFDLVSNLDWLRLAHDYVAQNAGSKTAGCDGLVMADFDQDLEGNLLALREALRSDTFVPCPVRRAYIPKASGKVRPLGIPSIRDRIVQEAVRMALEPIFEAGFSRFSFGFRPCRCTMDAIRHIMAQTRERARYFWVIEGDISAYFDTINHRKLMKLLRRRVEDDRLLDLVWAFLRAGVMERKLFKDTTLGTPQGGIVSPLLANVYLHELDRFMEGHADLTDKQRAARRRKGMANFAYARYADDFVVLCNGSKEQAEGMRGLVHQFLADRLRLTLSLEKTKLTHVNDGFDFLGFHLERSRGGKGKMVTRLTIPDKALKKHLDTIRAATAPSTHADSFRTKLLALNRIIRGWCRYYRYTSRPMLQFRKPQQEAYRLLAHWLGRKHQLSLPKVYAKFSVTAEGRKTLGDGEVALLRHMACETGYYLVSPFKPNPYTTRAVIEREELPADRPWLGTELRPGMADLRPLVLERDGYECRLCHRSVTEATAQVDHVRPVRSFKRPVDANRLENLWTLCVPCHKEKTELDRQRESRMR
jgi:group II intron reverse transcriptase/maturase